jgi:RNA polymerase primary sigma factor
MIKANLRLVVKIAHEYQNYGVPLLDFINEGNIGLIKAVERFNPKKGAKLSTYAAFWIKQCIRRALSHQARTIRLPNHLATELFKLRKAAVELEQKLGRPPTDDELAQSMKTTPARIGQLQRVGQSISSLDASLGAAEDSEVLAGITGCSAESPYVLLDRKTSEATLKDLLKERSSAKPQSYVCAFGLNDKEEETLEEMDKNWCDSERIRQLETIALKKPRKRLSKLEAVSAPVRFEFTAEHLNRRRGFPAAVLHCSPAEAKLRVASLGNKSRTASNEGLGLQLAG